MNDFFSQSGWFSHPGLPHGKVALQHVIAKKAGLSYDRFVAMEQAVYLFDYRHGEKVNQSLLSSMNVCEYKSVLHVFTCKFNSMLNVFVLGYKFVSRYMLVLPMS